MQVMWFKRDLRVEDNQALVDAASKGAILPLYILEPELWQQPDMSSRQYQFLIQCLNTLDESLSALGQSLIIRVGDAVEILAQLHRKHHITSLWSHQETWNSWTYQRDKKVKAWVKINGIKWHEPVQNGVIRCLNDRNGWATQWYRQMAKSLVSPPLLLKKIDEASEQLPSKDELGLQDDNCLLAQSGGRQAALQCLQSFLYERGQGYTKEMSSPVTAFTSCSRLSTHLAFGTVSIREVFHAANHRSQTLRNLSDDQKGRWPSAMRSFLGRLRWHCHFIQKLEDEPRIEFENLHSAYNGLRENMFNEKYFDAWKTGMTGYPMVDACMRALTATGWLNFRMRAMIMSFASYHLWLHWRKPALHLAKLFTDYEPGIHYSQVQMQSGTTGINAIRIYNPIKQGLDHDPTGDFIRHWIPEISALPSELIHTPWQAPLLMNGYPMPIIDEKIARKFAADKLFSLRKNQSHQTTARRIAKKHASRKKTNRAHGTKKTVPQQTELPLWE